jgi:hypothetical protein
LISSNGTLPLVRGARHEFEVKGKSGQLKEGGVSLMPAFPTSRHSVARKENAIEFSGFRSQLCSTTLGGIYSSLTFDLIRLALAARGESQ